MHIEDKDITIVVQGPDLENITPKVLDSINKLFKKSQKIFSTWSNQCLTKYNGFQVIKSLEPTSFLQCEEPRIYYSVNRLIISTINGVYKSKKKYLLKIRSDMYFKNKNFIKKFFRFKKRSQDYAVLNNRVILSSHFSVICFRQPLPFHYSDWFFFGETADIKNIFEIPLCKDKKESLWFKNKKKPRLYFGNYLCRFRAEQYIFFNFFKKYFKTNLDDGYDLNKDKAIISEKFLVNNFLIMSPNQLGFSSLKHKGFDKNYFPSLLNPFYTFKDWFYLYKKYIDIKFTKHNFFFQDLLSLLFFFLRRPKRTIFLISNILILRFKLILFLYFK